MVFSPKGPCNFYCRGLTVSAFAEVLLCKIYDKCRVILDLGSLSGSPSKYCSCLSSYICTGKHVIINQDFFFVITLDYKPFRISITGLLLSYVEYVKLVNQPLAFNLIHPCSMQDGFSETNFV